MKTGFLRTAGFAFAVVMMNVFVSNAQGTFYETEWEDGKKVLITKYVIGSDGIDVKESVSKYTYDENGEFLKKEVYVWRPQYIFIMKNNRGKCIPDYGESNWVPTYCIERKKDFMSNLISKKFRDHLISLELLYWNKKTKKYDKLKERIIYQLNDSGSTYNYLASQKGNKLVEGINKIKLNKDLLTEFSEIKENIQK